MIYAKPFIWTESNPYEVTAVLDEFVAHPEFLASSGPAITGKT
jgi:hypothetical protein